MYDESVLQADTPTDMATACLKRLSEARRVTRELVLYGGSLRSHGDTAFTFLARAACGTSFVVPSIDLNGRIERFHATPTILLSFLGGTQTEDHSSVRYCALHDWVLGHPECIETLRDDSQFRLSVKDFRPVGANGEALAAAIAEEANRVQGGPQSVWRGSPSPTLPMTFADLLANFGNLPAFEPTRAVRHTVRKQAACLTDPDLARALRDLWTGALSASAAPPELPEIQRWASGIARQVSKRETETSRNEFRKFVGSVLAYGQRRPFYMPGFTWVEVSNWRIFLSYFPHGLDLLRCVLEGPEGKWDWRQISAALHLTACLAFNDDSTQADNCRDLVRRSLERFRTAHVYDLEHYTVVRQAWLGSARVEGRFSDIGSTLDLFRAHREHEYEHALHCGYYGDRDRTIQAITTIVEHPKPRDVHLRGLQEATLEEVIRIRQPHVVSMHGVTEPTPPSIMPLSVDMPDRVQVEWCEKFFETPHAGNAQHQVMDREQLRRLLAGDKDVGAEGIGNQLVFYVDEFADAVYYRSFAQSPETGKIELDELDSASWKEFPAKTPSGKPRAAPFLCTVLVSFLKIPEILTYQQIDECLMRDDERNAAKNAQADRRDFQTRFRQHKLFGMIFETIDGEGYRCKLQVPYCFVTPIDEERSRFPNLQRTHKVLGTYRAPEKAASARA